MIMMTNDIQGWLGSKFSQQGLFLTFVLQLRENPEKKIQPEKLTWPGIEPRPARCKATMLLIDHNRWVYICICELKELR